jgi:DHA2 family multidrug resistance protein-like MFS transporter
MALLLALGPVLLPEFRDPAAGRLDLVSAAMSLGAVLPVVYGLKGIAQDGLGWPPALSIAAGLAFGAAFLRRQRASAHPMIDVRLFAESAFGASLAANTLVFFVNFGTLLFFSQYLQLVVGLSPLAAGLWTVPQFVAFIAGSMLTTRVVRRVRPAFAMAGGLLVAALGFGMLARVDGASGLAAAVAASVVYSFGLAPLTTLATDLMVGAAPPERAGAASAISETSSEFGGALGIAVLGSIATAVYRERVAGALPGGVPPEAAEAARDTLGGAVAAAGGLPGPLGAELLEASRGAFMQALQVAASTGAAIALIIAILVLLLLRGARTGAEAAEQPRLQLEGTDPALTLEKP